MRTLLLFFIGLISYSHSHAQAEIAWSDDYEISWSDFKHKVGRADFYKAWTYSGIRFNVQTVNQQIEIGIQCYFSKDNSWVHKDHTTQSLLNHERRHFDITEIYARKMRQELAKYQVSAKEFVDRKLMEKVEEVFNALYDEMEDLQKKYDRESNHSIDQSAQADWDKWVKEELNRLRAFAS
jgi:hypothetical protein